MITIRRSEDRGHEVYDWLDTRHTFSFAEYFDPAHMSFRSLRVINEDRVKAGAGFPKHPHRDMEILTYVLEGALEHRDSMGNGSVIQAGEMQRMSAGQGVTHSEYNHSATEPVHFLQIWIMPEEKGLTPSYEQKSMAVDGARDGKFRLLAAPDGGDGAVQIHQDARIYSASLDLGQRVKFMPEEGRHVWVQVIKGRLLLNGAALKAGDGAAVSGEQDLEFEGIEPSELLLFDLA